MMLIEQTRVPARSLPLGVFKEHLRLGTGFADEGIEEALLDGLLRAALAAIESRIGKALIARRFVWSLTAWGGIESPVLPVAPVREVVEVRALDARGTAEVITPEVYALESELHRPRLRFVGRTRPSVPGGGQIEIDFEAGFGPDWRDVPADLAQAVFLLAAHYHEHRYATGDGERAIPFGVTTLIERWRPLRTLGGSAS